MAPKATDEKPKRPWRESIEGITVAVIMAVFLKYFLVEAYKIPSGSMQPTLMGSPAAGIFDRILVDKLSYHLRDPERYEVAVFKHPLNRSLNMIKRIVGMPGEWLRIHNGDLWTKHTEEQPWTVLRRPESVQKGMWRKLTTDGAWRAAEGTQGWEFDGDRVVARGAGVALFPPPNVTIRNGYTDGYAPRIAAAIKSHPRFANARDVGDVRLTGIVEAAEGCSAVAIQIQEGSRRYRFVLPGPAHQEGDGGVVRPRLEVSGYEDAPAAVLAESGATLEAGRELHFAVQNLDDQLRFELDGEVVLELEIPPASNQATRIALEVEGGAATFARLEAFRDIYYIKEGMPQKVWNPIPEGEYVLLGDNTLDSADARDWRRARLELREGSGSELPVGTILDGNSRRSNRKEDANPYVAPSGHLFFRDVWGEVRAFPLGTVQEFPDEKGPTVPRELITGRAVCVFWPVSLRLRTARFSWIH